MSEIGIIGERDRVLCFMAAGFTVYEASPDDTEKAEKTLREAAERSAILFITATLAEALHDSVARYDHAATPAIIPLPESGGGLGTAAMKRAVERAVGADIVFRD
ncbi:MAG: V-type ATP synthase subunit F [Clostridia bacterium]|nr:V-type ATP synthase subunit F [Clostridia bacterium]